MPIAQRLFAPEADDIPKFRSGVVSGPTHKRVGLAKAEVTVTHLRFPDGPIPDKDCADQSGPKPVLCPTDARAAVAWMPQTGSPFCFRRLLSKADAGTKRRSQLTCFAIFPAA